MRFILPIFILISFAGAMPVLADPPGRVGRLAYFDGATSFHAAGQNEWAMATLNYPITTGDAVWTDVGAHAEIQIGSAEIYLDQGTELDVAQLDDKRYPLVRPAGHAECAFYCCAGEWRY